MTNLQAGLSVPTSCRCRAVGDNHKHRSHAGCCHALSPSSWTKRPSAIMADNDPYLFWQTRELDL